MGYKKKITRKSTAIFFACIIFLLMGANVHALPAAALKGVLKSVKSTVSDLFKPSSKILQEENSVRILSENSDNTTHPNLPHSGGKIANQTQLEEDIGRNLEKIKETQKIRETLRECTRQFLSSEIRQLPQKSIEEFLQGRTEELLLRDVKQFPEENTEEFLKEDTRKFLDHDIKQFLKENTEQFSEEIAQRLLEECSKQLFEKV